jgi:hypothetical protein
MKPVLLTPYHQIFDRCKPKTICEIGTHDGKSAVQFIDYCLKYNPKLSYTGYDIFDDVENDIMFHEQEVNGKGAGKYKKAKSNLEHRQRKNKRFQFKLVRGFTTDTLNESKYDFVYIDGGHSYETVKHDYSKLKDSSVIVFDDYQISGVKKCFDEIVAEEELLELEWEEALESKERCFAFMPHQRDGITKTHGKRVSHVQPVIFNR